MPSFRFRVVDERVAAGACADCDEPFAVSGDDLRKRRTEEEASGPLDDGYQLIDKGRERAGAVVLADDERVADQSVPAGVASGHDAGGVHARHGRIDGVVPVEEDAAGGERREVRHEIASHLQGLESVDGEDQHGGQFGYVLLE